MKSILFTVLFAVGSLSASIVETSSIEDIRSEITPNSLVFFNIAEVLTDTETSLGTSAWRRYVRKSTDRVTHDILTLYIFKKIPAKTPELITPLLISDLQNDDIATLAFTSRGRQEWYSSLLLGIDLLTEEILLQLNIDFSRTASTSFLENLEANFSNYFHKNIIYATNEIEKGELLAQMLKATSGPIEKVIFVDDKIDSLRGIEKALGDLNIPFAGFLYNLTNKKPFDPMIAHIQLDYFLTLGILLTDEDAFQIKEQSPPKDPEVYFQDILNKFQRKLEGRDLQNNIPTLTTKLL